MHRVPLRPRAALLGFLACCALAGRGMALDPSKRLTQYILEAWEVEQGLPQSSVTALAQTGDGYLWLGTQEGLARFDGFKFTAFDKRTVRGFPNNHINVLLAARDGSLWAGTYGGLVQHHGGTFRFYGRSEGLPHDHILALEEDDQGTVWVGTEEGGLCRFTGGSFEPVRWDPPMEGTVHVIRQTRDGALWVGSRGALHRLHGGAVRRWTRQEGLPASTVLALREGRNGTLWMGTASAGVYAFDGGTFRAWGPDQGLAGARVEALAVDADGNLWAGTFTGLTRLSGDRIDSMGIKEGLSDDVVLSLLADRAGNLWVGTSNNGLNRLRDGAVIPWGKREGLSSNATYCVLEDRGGAVWVGTKAGGLNRMKDGGFRVFSKRDGLPDDDIVALMEAADGTLWIGCNEGVVRLRDGKVDPDVPKEVRQAAITCFMEARDGALWMGSDGGGLYRAQDGAVRAFTRRDGLTDLSILSMAQTPDGVLWFGTDGGGLQRFADGSFTALGTGEGLSNGMVMVLLPRPDGALWIGTYGGGLNRLQNGRLAACTAEDGLFDDNIFSILDDGEGNLWMSSNLGIFTVPIRELDEFMDGGRERVSCRAFGTADGMRSRECNGGSHPSAWRGRDGRLWFTTVRGVAALDPRHLRKDALFLSVVIEFMGVSGRRLSNPALAGRLSYPPGRNDFEFHYTAIGAPVPDRVRFRYKLEGYDRDWMDAGTRRAAFYTNLKPGGYAFLVEASVGDGLWSAAPGPVLFTLLPHWYERPVFWVAGLAALAFLVWGSFRWRLRRMERRERELAAMVDARTRDLMEANQKLEAATWLADQLSRSDGLTDLVNRRVFDEFLDSEWKRSVRTGMDLSLLMIDLDFFKDYNDAGGHPAGDECLRRVAHRINEIMNRGVDLVARYGGEEFAVVLFNTGAEGAAIVAERLRAAVEALQIPHGSSTVSPVVTISVGHATRRPQEGGDPEELVAAADRALYAAKAAGRNCVRGQSE